MTDIKRRQMVKLLGASAVAVPVSALVTTLPSHAADMPMVDVKAPQAVALSYIEVSEKPDQVCKGCSLYQDAQATDKGAPCPLFQGSLVTAGGWCSAYTPRG